MSAISSLFGDKCAYLIRLFLHPFCRHTALLLHSCKDYGSFVYILADLEQLAAAELFVGTFSSNVGRLVMLLREDLGKPRNSTISMDRHSWYPGRQRTLVVD